VGVNGFRKGSSGERAAIGRDRRRSISETAANFNAWVDAVEQCLLESQLRLPKRRDRRELAEFVLTAMEGGVMQARTHRDVAYFDRAVRQLRTYFGYLERDAARGSAPVSTAVPRGTVSGRAARTRQAGGK
jgi:hypothetical protein